MSEIKSNRTKAFDGAESWDKDFIGELAQQAHTVTEDRVKKILSNLLPCDFDIRRAVHEKGQYAPWDLEIIKNDRTSMDIVCKIEVEVSTPGTWSGPKIPGWPALNLVTRKGYDHPDIFLKFSNDYQSCFVVSLGFLRRAVALKILVPSFSDSKFDKKTTNLYYKIPRKTMEPNLIKAGWLCVCENNNFEGLSQFLTNSGYFK